MIHLNVTRLGVYIALVLLAVFGELPWWVTPLAILYDTTGYIHFMLPWKRKEWEEQQEKFKKDIWQKYLEQWQSEGDGRRDA